MEDCKPSLTPMVQSLKLSKFEWGELVDGKRYWKLIGSLIYLTNTRSNLSYLVNIHSRFKKEPRETHWNLAKRVLKYIQGTKEFGLLYKNNKILTLVGYSDTNFAGDIDDQKSTPGYLMNMGSTVSILELQKVGNNCQFFSKSRLHISLGSSMRDCMAT